MSRSRGEFAGTARFEIRGLLGQGGMGAVYEAFDRERLQTVALKTLERFDAQSLLRFKTEFRALHDIEHPHLVSLYELFEEDGEWFFTMELVRGVDFLAHVRAGRRPAPPRDGDPLEARDVFDERRLRQALAQLTQGVAALHRAGRIHRDIKPSNIRVTTSGQVILLDFGLVTSTLEGDPSTQGFIGTATYMAPEQALEGDVGPAADWYSVGVLLYEALTARLPHTGPTALQLVLNKQQPPEKSPRGWIADAPADLDALAVRLLAPRPGDRPSAAELLEVFGTELAPSGADSADPRGAPFVGRDDELAELRAAFDESAGEPVVALVEGASGLGKSELVRHFTEALVREVPNTVVLSGRCYERDSVTFKAFDGLVDELARTMGRLPKADAAALLPLQAGLLPRLFPVLQRVEAIAAAPPEEEPQDPQELRRQVFGALRELLTRLAKRARLVLVIDDLQWTDRDSLVLLQEVLGDATAPRVLLIGTLRPVEPDLLERLDASVRGLRRRTLALGPLSPEQSRALTSKLLPAARPDTLEAIARESGGYPLFIMELARHLEGVEDEDRGRGVDLDEALWVRISRLPAELLHVLQLICTASAPITLEAAANAAELSREELFRVIAGLRAAHLARTTGARADAITPYHDRIRETVDEHLGPARRRECHQRLALALARSGAARSAPHALVGHTLAAGDAAGAARHAEAAARDAVAATAFDRAVDFFRMAIELGQHDENRRRSLRLELAWALLNAGRGSESAAAFDAAAEGADPATRRDCQRLSAEQLLISGHIDEGLARLAEALVEIDEALLETPRRALFAVLWRRLRLRFRGLSWKERPASEISASERARLQVVGASALGLSMVDSIRGAAFNARFVQLALQTGDPLQVARALGAEATMSAYQGKYERSKQIIDAVEALRTEHPDDPYIAAWAAISRGGYAYFRGDFASGEAAMREAGGWLAKVGGSTWERNNSTMFVLFCLRYQGKLAELDALVESLRRDAERRGDLYMEISVRRYGSRYGFLVQDRPDDALADLEGTDWPAPQDVFHLQDWQKLEARCEIALYAGHADDVWDAANQGFDALARSLLLRITTVRNPAAYLRGRLALAASGPRADLSAVEKVARQLLREREDHVDAWGHLLLAAVAHRRGQRERAIDHLRAAVGVCEAHGMGYHLAVAQRRLAQLVGGEEGALLSASSGAWMTAQRVRDPARMSEVLAPGFG